MASKRFLIVPEDSSAARMPLPGVTMARATLLRSARFIEVLQKHHAVAHQNRRFSGNCLENVRRSGGVCEARAACSGDPRVKLALAVPLGHFGCGQHLLDLARLACGIEFLQPLLARLGPGLDSGLQVLSWFELVR